jgi:hypothetical protein
MQSTAGGTATAALCNTVGSAGQGVTSLAVLVSGQTSNSLLGFDSSSGAFLWNFTLPDTVNNANLYVCLSLISVLSESACELAAYVLLISLCNWSGALPCTTRARLASFL